MIGVAVLLANFLEFKDHRALYILLNDLKFQVCDETFCYRYALIGEFSSFTCLPVVYREE